MVVPKEARCFVLNEPPVAEVNLDPESANATFKLVKKPLRDLNSGEILVKTLYLSNDPTQRAWIQKGLKPESMYVEPVTQGEIMRLVGLGQVVALKNGKYKEGDILNTTLKWSDYSIISESAIFSKISDTSVPLPMYLDVLGTTGLTAYFGLLQVAKLKSSDVVVISAALGATGSMCVQIAKKVIGCKKVIGISGGREKCHFVELLGADHCVDYHSKSFQKDLSRAIGKDKFCDVFFDGVGGKILDAALGMMRPFGRVVACGAIAGYNDFGQSRVLNWPQIVVKRLNVKGFIVLDFIDQYAEGIRKLHLWIELGLIRYDKSTYSVVDLTGTDADFAKIPASWGELFKPTKGPGKLLTQVSRPKL
ncbi:quinone oxidoreductase [Metschnikowia bicuspidata var. bicuspidata NRRL YB-4993]|uniref:Quinone oxidoreductase n=1 Tax=Metschnikowia bicuspidata var. bicuspidata NRRL YB-4993 TaxID=869754 RepID=A0A1A0H9D6_9ASCO|nr:quinone oxidoreductase [Metschnikowia bicuspidata var. bicuspidata NRRL YB-4993]OBA20488.1 quinone oxidoreductase [Metschnikowia bicuspidata var. bicuspidata NRRL YB-4993]